MSATMSDLRVRIQKLLQVHKDDMFVLEELEDLRERADLTAASSIAVVGQFSVGKSALLNALLGEQLLAERRIETTKVTTRIRNAGSMNSPKAILHYKNGESLEIPVTGQGELAGYTTFQGDKTDELVMADVYWPVTFLNDEVILIDTPGSNSITQEAFAATERELRMASAVLFLFNGRKGLDRTDYELLGDLYLRQKKLFLVATHIDGLTSAELQQVLESTGKQLTALYADIEEKIHIFPVSSKLALEGKQTDNPELLKQSRILELEQALLAYTTGRQYELADIQAISYDLETLEAELAVFRQGAEEEEAVQERERQLRLERLSILTRQEYASVLGYGKELLELRQPKIAAVMQESKHMIDETMKNKKLELYQSFRDFKGHTAALSQLQTTSLTVLKQEYINHIEGIRIIYGEVLEDFQSKLELLHLTVEETVQTEDGKFVDSLEADSTQTKLNWPAFRSSMLGLPDVQARAVDYDHELFADYERDREEYEAEHKRKVRQQEKIKAEQAQLVLEQQQGLSKLQKKLDEEVSQMGQKPDPVPRTETKGILFWKKEVVTGYDYTNRQRWEKNLASRFEEYESDKQRQLVEYRFKRDEQKKQEYQLQEQIDVLEQAEMELESRLFADFISSLESLREQAQHFYKQMEQEISELWTIQERHLLEYSRQHTGQVQELFSSFIQEQLEQALAGIALSHR